MTGSARAGVAVQLEPRSLPLADEGSLVVSPSASVTTDANGDFTAALVAGDYRLVVGEDDASLAQALAAQSTLALRMRVC